ncbi:hypothetical protein Cs7R123_52200 [Catellatospora sp. TT07R-123]|uniref:condensation domain-containing protein n=1 Tax=Catellatospora sp. TT07R-123 TaxID=2733863 RepID=UPI001B1D54CE|nr:condensation domain-containing protein [Catellatospora sp. TT07R-123]GHJ47878.1 hypothetical protein Cs7R123_52200 [Catellatospora sp. TT07R-123]
MQVIPRRADAVTTAPLSLLQRRMWHLCTAYPGTASPIVAVANRISGPLDVPAFTAAVAAVCDRHDALRTTFALGADGPTQVIAPPGGTGTELADLSGAPDGQARAQELVGQLTGALLDLDGGRLVRSVLIRLADDDHVWCLAVHHLLADGESAMVIAREVAALYRGAALPDPPIGYADFAAWQLSEAAGGDLAYWVEQLSGVPVLELPCDFPRPPVKSTRADQVDLRLDPVHADAVDRLARAQRATPYMVLLTALLVVLARRSGQDDLCVGTPVSGRLLVETEDAVGLFGNMIALRADLSGAPTFAQLLARVRAVTIAGLGRQSVPFGQVVAAVDPPRDPSRTQVFQVIFALHTQTAGPAEPGLDWRPFGAGAPQILHDLVLDTWRGPSGLDITLRYDTGLFRPETAAAMAEQFATVLRAMAADADQPVFGGGGR